MNPQVLDGIEDVESKGAVGEEHNGGADGDLYLNITLKPHPLYRVSGHDLYIDLPVTRERANTDPQLALGTLVYTTNIIDPDACSVGGTSFINFFDYRTGGPVSSATGVTSVLLGNAIATRPTIVRLPGGKVISLTRLSDARTVVSRIPVGTVAGTTRRISWRELAN